MTHSLPALRALEAKLAKASGADIRTETANIAQARAGLSDILNKANYANTVTVLCRRDRPLCAIIPMMLARKID